MIGWLIAGMVIGAVLVTAMDRFWDKIASWLNNTAANAVERIFGYDAKKFMQRAVASVSKLRDMLHNNTVVYTKRDSLDTHIQKISLKGTAPVYEQEEEVKDTFERENTQVQEFEYKS